MILNRNQPIFKIEPLSVKDATLEKLVGEIDEAREDVKKSRLYTAQQVRQELGL